MGVNNHAVPCRYRCEDVNAWDPIWHEGRDCIGKDNVLNARKVQCEHKPHNF
eukprot:CAMPEP_0178380548 /NCGR_PEP_ID=MMETSP0689_2-20121128/5520_1 /TAXON_ID=160604 /ORGANISM="Amphidinium massartii, Strain CS-259" /LENGTH=51 /DNA_ID=CAMNT_0020000695 /DNA_START=260 /DNA_END=415 /DNA_ORIENTATION=+